MLESVSIECGNPSATVYSPAGHPGFAAWAAPFEYGDGSVGLSFDEAVAGDTQRTERQLPMLRFAEAAGIPVSYSTVECPADGIDMLRVYMRSDDGVRFRETGRCPRKYGAICNIGFPDGRIIGYGVPRSNSRGTGWADHIVIRESVDGGNTWRNVRELLSGTSPYLWRVRRLRDGTVVLLASLYGTPWGEGNARPTRNTLLPGETALGKILPFFMTSPDGVSFSPPCYILPGLGAHEFDFAELADGRLLFIAGDVQGTPVGRQYADKCPDGYILSPVLPIYKGAPPDPRSDPQGGYVPETVCYDAERHLLVGCRRGRGFSVSADEGENWFPLRLNGLTDIPYQPVIIRLTSGGFALYGHTGGDNALGQRRMRIVCVLLSAGSIPPLPMPGRLEMHRLLSDDASHYVNSFSARLTSGGKPLPGRRIKFRIGPYWNPDGSMNAAALSAAHVSVTAETGSDGTAVCAVPGYDGIPDIHLAYRIDAVFDGDNSTLPCRGPEMTVLALTPHRMRPYPYDAYMAEDQLFLSPDFLTAFPDAVSAINSCDSPSDIPESIRIRLVSDGILVKEKNGAYGYIPAVHSSGKKITAAAMTHGDLYR